MNTRQMAVLVMRPILGIVIPFLFFVNVEVCKAQNAFAYDQVSYLFEETGFGARAIGLGGAYISVSNDYSSIYWNPAGLGLIRQNEFFTSLTHNNRDIGTRFLGIKANNSQSKTAIGALGFAYPVEVYRGSLVLAAGYNRLHNYNSFFGYNGFNPGQSYMSYAFEEPVVPDQLTQNESLEIGGNLSQLSVGGAYQAAENLYLGATINYWTGENNYNRVFTELDLADIYNVYPNDFDVYKNNRIIDTYITGVDVVLGALFQVRPQINIGFTLRTPRYITIEEDWVDSEDIVFDNGDTIEFDKKNGIFKYKVRMPYVFGVGASFAFPHGLITGEVRYTDWSQFVFRDDSPLEGVDKYEANRNIKRTLQGVVNPRAGIELQLSRQTTLRAGFSFTPSPLSESDFENARKYLSFGLGFKLGGSSGIDIAYRRGWWDIDTISEFSNEIVNENHSDNRIFTSLLFNF